jgi:hypothetical protein
LLTWVAVLLGDASPEARTDMAQLMFAHACWLAPDEDFDLEAVRLLREDRFDNLKGN